MNERVPIEVFPPGDYIRDELESRGWTQDVLATIIDRSPRLVNEIVTGKRAITPDTAQVLAEAFGTSALLWMNLESAFRLSRVQLHGNIIARRAHLFSIGPVKEMIRRGWIEQSDNIDVLEGRVQAFFELSDLTDEPTPFLHAARKSTSYAAVTPAQCAWLFRAKHIAKSIKARPFTETRLIEGLNRLRELRCDSRKLEQVSSILADAGVRFFVLEHLPQSRIDGSAFWLDAKSPVVTLSLRFDRIDWFWHTLMHDLMHIVHNDGRPSAARYIDHEILETDLIGQSASSASKRPRSEQLADEAACEFLLPSALLDEFIARNRPRYSKKSIIEFAEQVGVHPGIVVGRLQYSQEIQYSHSREMLEKVRDIVTAATLTDGWGHHVTLPAT